MKGFKVFLVLLGLAFLFLIFLAVKAVMRGIEVQKERPLSTPTQQEQPVQEQYPDRRRPVRR